MTDITPDTLPRAATRPRPRHRRGHRPGRASVLAAALLSALLLAAPASVLPATGAVAATSPSPGPTPPGSTAVAFAMAPGDRGIVGAGGAVVVDLSVSNPASTMLSAGEVRVERGNTPLPTREALDAWLADGSGVDGYTAAGSTVLDTVPARGTTSVPLGLDAAAFADAPAGVYPLQATYTTPRGELTSRSTVVVTAGDQPIGSVTVIVPITAGAITTALPTSDELAALTAPDGLLRAQLDAVSGTNAVLAVDPAIAVAIRALGGAAPGTATAWLDELLSLPNERFALQFGDADLATQIGAGLTAPLSVGDVTALAPDLAPAPTPTPTATAGSTGTGTIPTLDSIGLAAPAVLWPASGSVGSTQIGALGAVTVDDAPSLTLVDSASVTGSSTAASAAHARAGEADLLVYDTAVSDALRRASEAVTEVAQDAAVAESSAYSALSDPTTPLAVAVDRSTARTSDGIAAAIAAATALPGRELVGLSALRAVFPVDAAPAEVTADETDVAWIDAFTQFRGDADALAQFATILAQPALLTVPDRARTLQVIGNAWHGNSAWADAVAGQRERTAQTLDAVELVPVTEINLFGTSAPLSFTVRNDLAFPVSLVLYTLPGDPRIIVQTTTTVEAGAAQATRVNVPVEARVGSGEAQLSLQLRSPTMVAIGDPMDVTVNVRAEWEQIGVVVLSVLVGGFLVIGVIRTVRRRRRGADDGDGDGDDTESTTGADDTVGAGTEDSDG
ncbi:DUF6049 family protein [Microbacterium telephonicum]|uniref:2-oxoglutarate dehydrogenase n=1 Tax=Microbacterium telephonicum TaxID=1714841 RepID=A0A498C8L5_9MICO|nr:DUF6049 family protein [Microbacterium telephonicum]RLK52185.1 hypothetical protein C7474_0114 [Microbacterium telephonicum]